MDNLLEQLKQRRLALGLTQSDMFMRIGVSRQQYQRLESKGNPRLDTLELVAQGLAGEVLFIPAEKLDAVKAVLNQADIEHGQNYSHLSVQSPHTVNETTKEILADNPWQGLLRDNDE